MISKKNKKQKPIIKNKHKNEKTVASGRSEVKTGSKRRETKMIETCINEEEGSNNVREIEFQVAKLMKSINSLKATNPEEGDELIEKITLKIHSNSFGDKEKLCNDPYSELLSSTSFNDFREYIVDENILAAAFPTASAERIIVERQFMSSYYVM